MSNLEEKNLFSKRLKTALTQCDHQISPTYLASQFNMRYSGHPISVQSANNWLLGKAIPNQDKLSVLCIWLNVSAQWLRFGDADSDSNKKGHNLSNPERDLLLKFNKLSTTQQSLIHKIIDEFIVDS